MNKGKTLELASTLGISLDRLPRHVAIIMDGNGRWAQKRFLPRILGHRNGAKIVREIVETAGSLGLQALTLFAFSDDNWKRPTVEVDIVMRLLEAYLQNERQGLMDANIRLEAVGDLSRLPLSTQKVFKETRHYLKNNDGMVLVVALSYGARAEIAAACKRIAVSLRDGLIEENDITPDLLNAHLHSKDVPELDLLIRTSGEYRVSNFLLWQMAYAEFYFTSTLWPDFTPKHFLEAVLEYQKRDRRFGAINNPAIPFDQNLITENLEPLCSSSEF